MEDRYLVVINQVAAAAAAAAVDSPMSNVSLRLVEKKGKRNGGGDLRRTKLYLWVRHMNQNRDRTPLPV